MVAGIKGYNRGDLTNCTVPAHIIRGIEYVRMSLRTENLQMIDSQSMLSLGDQIKLATTHYTEAIESIGMPLIIEISTEGAYKSTSPITLTVDGFPSRRNTVDRFF